MSDERVVIDCGWTLTPEQQAEFDLIAGQNQQALDEMMERRHSGLPPREGFCFVLAVIPADEVAATVIRR